jgi:hypothetical protein
MNCYMGDLRSYRDMVAPSVYILEISKVLQLHTPCMLPVRVLYYYYLNFPVHVLYRSIMY